MNWLRRLVGGSSGPDGRQPDYLAEALELESRGDVASALVSYQLALRERPDDLRVLQNMAIACSRTGRPDEAIRHYRRALQLDGSLAGAHYGLAFLLLRRGDTMAAEQHLQAFLRHGHADDAESLKFRAHAERTLSLLRDGVPEAPHVAQGDDEDALHDATRVDDRPEG
ncbi:MAG: tetratricopeptide repeat protein [Gemmatimonadetes bacterium]|nr:tetratricopeptide repeat protein [Gemmatimonadota bacterium]